MLPQVLKSPRARSFRSAVSECAVRVLARKLLKHTSPTSAVMSIPPSNRLCAGNWPLVPNFGTYGQYEPVWLVLDVPHAALSEVHTVVPLESWERRSCRLPAVSPPLPTHS